MSKTRKKIARCAEDQRILLNELMDTFRVHLSEDTNDQIDEIYGLAVKIEILAKEKKHGKRRSAKSSGAALREGSDLL